MAYKLELPDIGEGVVEAEVQQWFVKPGDDVAEDQPLVEVMTDKATVVIPSPRRGRVVQLFWKVGELAKVHTPLVELELDAGAPRPPAESPVRAAAAQAADTASTRSSPSTSPGPGSVAANAPAAAAGNGGAKPLATPAVRALAREMGVDLRAVAPTGPGGRVTKEDLAQFAGGAGAPTPIAQAARHGGAPTPIAQPAGHTGAATSANGAPIALPAKGTGAPTPPRGGPDAPDERIAIRGVRKRIAENMARSKRTAAHFTFVEQCDVTELVRVKDRIAAAAKDEGVKITFLPFIVKAAVAALRKHPKLNASVDDERGELVLHKRYDIGIAAATDAGLVVPVVRGADRLSLVELAREIERLGADARAGKARPEDMGRSTFTITSLGALGGMFATPVLNYPELGILGIHRVRPTPVVKDGQVVVRDVMHVSVTSDHRLVDGHEAAAFAYEVIRLLEEPNLLFMHMA